MAVNKREVIAMLDAGTRLRKGRTRPLCIIDEILTLGLPHIETITRNLFVRDDKKQSYYLITVKEEKRSDLKEFNAWFGMRRLSFASEEALERVRSCQWGHTLRYPQRRRTSGDGLF